MHLLRGWESLPDPRVRDSFVTWGVFDGVHRGHQRVLRKLLELARGGATLVITFDPHPARVLQGIEVPLLCSLEERLERIEANGVGAALVLPFTREFAQTTAERFLRDTVIGRIGARGILLGHDSQFGKDREGDYVLLSSVGASLGIEVHEGEPEMHEGGPISSSLIRQAIAEGKIEEASDLLGRPPTCRGVVVRGDRRGTTLGFPTANLELGPMCRPPRGIYAVDGVVDGRRYAGVANLGTRPTFYGEGGPELLEVHWLDFPGGDLYGRVLEVRFRYRLRDELRFSGVEELRRAIEADVAEVRRRSK